MSPRMVRDEDSGAQSNLPARRLRNFCLAPGCGGHRETFLRDDHVWRRHPLCPADCGHSGDAREFSCAARRIAAVLEVAGRRFLSDAAVTGLLVLLRHAEAIFQAQPGYWRHAVPAGPCLLSFCVCYATALSFRRTRYSPAESRFRAA